MTLKQRINWNDTLMNGLINDNMDNFFQLINLNLVFRLMLHVKTYKKFKYSARNKTRVQIINQKY